MYVPRYLVYRIIHHTDALHQVQSLSVAYAGSFVTTLVVTITGLIGPMVHIKPYIFKHFYEQYLVLLTMVSCNSDHPRKSVFRVSSPG